MHACSGWPIHLGNECRGVRVHEHLVLSTSFQGGHMREDGGYHQRASPKQ